MRRSTPGVLNNIESHTPRACRNNPNSFFRASSGDSRRFVPPPVTFRNQPPPLPPKHHSGKGTVVDFYKHKDPLESLDTNGRYVYESISDSNVSSHSNQNHRLTESYATRDFSQSSANTPAAFRSISPCTIGIHCGSRSVSSRAFYDTGTLTFPFSTAFDANHNSDLLKGPCTCSLGVGKGTKQAFSANNQSPVWSKMPSVVARSSDAVQSKTMVVNVRDPNHSEKKPTCVDNHPWTVSRFSRTMSRFFRWKVTQCKCKSKSCRSRSVCFTDFDDKFNVEIAPKPFSLRAIRSPTKSSPSLPLPPQSIPLPPTVPSRTEKATTSTSSASYYRDVTHRKQPVQAATKESTLTKVPTCSSSSGVSCVHHVHHIHHVHHVHHHLHHMSPPPSFPPAFPPSSGSQAVTSPSATEDAATLITVLENTATIRETPPLSLLPPSVLKESKSAERQPVGNSHTYSAYGVRGEMAPTRFPISSTPPPQSSSSTLHRQNTAVCSNSICITAHCRHSQGSPGDCLCTPTSIELAELAKAGAEAVISNGGDGGRTATMTTTNGGSYTDPLPPSPNATSVVPSCSNSPIALPSSSAGPGVAVASTRLMHHMHHHHMLHHLRSPSTTSATANASAISPARPIPEGSPSTAPDHRSSFQKSMKALRKMGWYWGPLSFTEAEKLLANRPNGTFLVRDSAHDTFFLSLSFRVRGITYHTRIEHNQGRFSFWFEPELHSASTVVEFIEKAVAHSIGGKYHYFLQTNSPGQQPVEVSLLYPLSRFQVVQSLKHLSRFTILTHVRRDHVARLPLPPGQIGYLLEKQVYWESLEDFEETIRDRPPLEFTPVSASSS